MKRLSRKDNLEAALSRAVRLNSSQTDRAWRTFIRQLSLVTDSSNPHTPKYNDFFHALHVATITASIVKPK